MPIQPSLAAFAWSALPFSMSLNATFWNFFSSV